MAGFEIRLCNLIDLFHATDLFWYPLKSSENLWFSDVFSGYQKKSVAWNGLCELLIRNIKSLSQLFVIFYSLLKSSNNPINK